VIVTHGFLKRLARHELEESAIGRFAEPEPAGAGAGDGNGRTPAAAEREPEDQTVGSSPWAAVAALAASFVLLSGVLAWAVRADRLPDRLRRL
jgi:hypothetical protein